MNNGIVRMMHYQITTVVAAAAAAPVFWRLLQVRPGPLKVSQKESGARFLQAGFPSDFPTSSVKAVKEKQYQIC